MSVPKKYIVGKTFIEGSYDIPGNRIKSTVFVKIDNSDADLQTIVKPRTGSFKKRSPKSRTNKTGFLMQQLATRLPYNSPFPGEIIVIHQVKMKELELPPSFRSSKVAFPQTSRLNKTSKTKDRIPETLSAVEIPNKGTFNVKLKDIYLPTEINLSSMEVKVPVLFQQSQYLQQQDSIWKLSVIIGAENFKKLLKKFDNVVDENFVIESFKESKEFFYTNKDYTIFVDTPQPKFIKKYGELIKISILDTLSYLTVDDIECIIEKTIFKK